METIQLRITNPTKVLAPVFHKLNAAQTRFVINYGGTASGKSFGAAQKEVLKSCEKPHITLVIRKVGSTLRDSVIPSFRRRISEFKLNEYFRYNKTDRELTNIVTGSRILFRGLDDPEKMKSFEGLTRIMIEEASELEFEDFTEVNRRIRGVKNIQITLNFNPIHEEHWLKKHFFDQEIPNTTLIHSTYKDNPFLTPEDAEQIEQMRLFNYNQYRVYALGEWGLTENGNPWLHAFDAEKHVKPVAFKKEYPIYLSFDFNISPVSCLVWQMSPAKGYPESFVHCIDEFAVDVQLNELCRQIKAKYPVSIMYVTGDASGANSNVGFEQRHQTFYKMIQSYLRLSDKQMNINSRNMEHNDSRNLCNTMLFNYPNIFISPKCKKLLNDVQIATVDDTKIKAGVLKKDRGTYKMDVFDCFRYFMQTYFKEYAEKVYFSGKINT